MLRSTIIASAAVGFVLLWFNSVGAGEGDVILFARPFFQGKSREIYLESGRCFPLFGEWSMNVGSIKTDASTCIQIYRDPKCTGISKLLDGQYEEDQDQAENLATVGFLYRVEGLQIC